MIQSPTSTTTPVVHSQRLTKIFGDFWMRDKVRAVDGLDMMIEPGQIFGLIGPNGSGKSTTIKMILGLLHKTSGRLAVFGKPPEDLRVKKRIGYLPEESYLYPFLNSRETLEFYGKLFGLERRTRQRRINELLEMVGLDAVERRPIGQFSKGMQRRIGIAQALINDPDFLILDEPTSGLDPLGIRQVKDLILDLGKRGKTILLSSHLLSEVEDVCDTMLILYGGRKRAEGRREDLLLADDRTVIEVDSLTPEQAAKVSRFIEEEGRLVRSVSPARQSLESLFLSIVDQARSERAPTHGAAAGGPTAAFLRGVDAGEAEGEALIDSLMREEATAPPARAGAPRESERESAPPEGSSPDEVLESLLVEDEKDQTSAGSEKAGSQSDDDLPEQGAPVSRQAEGQEEPEKPIRRADRKPPDADVDQTVIDSLLGSEGDESDQRS